MYYSILPLPFPSPAPMPIEEQVVSIFSGVRGFLDVLDPANVTAFEKDFLPFIKSEHSDILKSIATSNQLTKETEEKLKTVTKSFVDSWRERRVAAAKA